MWLDVFVSLYLQSLEIWCAKGQIWKISFYRPPSKLSKMKIIIFTDTKLPVVKKRYDPLYGTSCSLCDSDRTGDEFHVLLNCEFFKEERKIMLLVGKERFYHAIMLLFSEIMNYNS